MFYQGSGNYPFERFQSDCGMVKPALCTCWNLSRGVSRRIYARSLLYRQPKSHIVDLNLAAANIASRLLKRSRRVNRPQ